MHNLVARHPTGSDVTSLQVAASCTGLSRDLDWHRAITVRSALPSLQVGGSHLSYRAHEGPMVSVTASGDSLQLLCLSTALQGFACDHL